MPPSTRQPHLTARHSRPILRKINLPKDDTHDFSSRPVSRLVEGWVTGVLVYKRGEEHVEGKTCQHAV